MKIIIDTREQCPLDFAAFPDVVALPGSLQTGDYSVVGLEHLVAVERKSLSDLVASLTHERERFERELQRAAGLRCFCVVVESAFTELLHGKYRSKANPHALAQSLAAFQVRYRVPFVFTDNAEGAAYWTHSVLSKFCRELDRLFEAIGRRAA